MTMSARDLPLERVPVDRWPCGHVATVPGWRCVQGDCPSAEQVGDPIAVLPVLFHLLWRQELHVELSMPLHTDAVVTAVSA